MKKTMIGISVFALAATAQADVQQDADVSGLSSCMKLMAPFSPSPARLVKGSKGSQVLLMPSQKDDRLHLVIEADGKQTTLSFDTRYMPPEQRHLNLKIPGGEVVKLDRTKEGVYETAKGSGPTPNQELEDALTTHADAVPANPAKAIDVMLADVQARVEALDVSGDAAKPVAASLGECRKAITGAPSCLDKGLCAVLDKKIVKLDPQKDLKVAAQEAADLPQVVQKIPKAMSGQKFDPPCPPKSPEQDDGRCWPDGKPHSAIDKGKKVPDPAVGGPGSGTDSSSASSAGASNGKK